MCVPVVLFCFSFLTIQNIEIDVSILLTTTENVKSLNKSNETTIQYKKMNLSIFACISDKSSLVARDAENSIQSDRKVASND